MHAASTGANAVPIYNNNQRIDFTLPSLMERLQWVKSSGLKQAEFSSATDTNKHVTMYASGRMVFYTRVRHNGQRPRIELGEINTHTLDQIHQNYLDIRKKLADGQDPRQLRRRDMTYADFFEQIYVPHCENNQKKSLKADQSRNIHWLQPRFGHLKLSAIHNRMALDLVTEMKGAGKAVSTIRNVVSLLKAVLQLAVDMDMLAQHPIRYRPPALPVRIPKEAPKLGELAKFVHEALKCGGPEYGPGRMWALSALTAARSKELMDAKKTDVDIEAGIWYLPDQKSGKPGVILLSRQAKRIMQQLLVANTGEYLIPGLKGNAQISRPVKLFKRICQRAGVGANWSPHMLRKGFATTGVMSGNLSDLVVSRVLRHSSPEITRAAYILNDHEALRAANDIVGELILPLTGTQD